MKKIFALLFAFSFLMLTACNNSVSVEEPFSADFVITDPYIELTSVIFNSDYIGNTYSYDSDAATYSDIEDFFNNSVFSDYKNSVSLPNGKLKIALTGGFDSSDIQSLTEIIEMFNCVPSFCGMQEVSINDADYIIRFNESEKTSIKTDSYGNITGADISVPFTASQNERYASICRSLFNACGFSNFGEISLDSILGDADTLTDNDFLMLDLLYSFGKTGMSQSEFLSEVKNYLLNNTEVLS